jgi:hypothetical protein
MCITSFKKIFHYIKMEFKDNEKIYPALPLMQTGATPTAPPMGGGHTYRLQKIGEIQKQLETERDKRIELSKKYHRSVKIISNVDSALVVASMGLGAAGVGLLSTIIAAPIVIAMEATALGAGLLSIVGSQINKKLTCKAEKHEKVRVLAEAKLDTISDHISKALRDDMVSDEEYTFLSLANTGK